MLAAAYEAIQPQYDVNDVTSQYVHVAQTAYVPTSQTTHVPSVAHEFGFTHFAPQYILFALVPIA